MTTLLNQNETNEKNKILTFNPDNNSLNRLRHICKSFNLQRPVKVKIRKTGKSSQGKVGMCHYNVTQMQSIIGGHQVTGYMLQQNLKKNDSTSKCRKSLYLYHC